MSPSILRKQSLWKRFREWMQRDVEVQIWDNRKGMIKERDLKPIHIKGVIVDEDSQRTRKITMQGDSFAVTINPPFVSVLCPFREKLTKQQLIKQENGEYLLTVQGIPNHESA